MEGKISEESTTQCFPCYKILLLWSGTVVMILLAFYSSEFNLHPLSMMRATSDIFMYNHTQETVDPERSRPRLPPGPRPCAYGNGTLQVPVKRDTFQTVSPGTRFVYSAFLDDRVEGKVFVRITGLACGVGEETYWCHLWYRNATYADHVSAQRQIQMRPSKGWYVRLLYRGSVQECDQPMRDVVIHI